MMRWKYCIFCDVMCVILTVPELVLSIRAVAQF